MAKKSRQGKSQAKRAPDVQAGKTFTTTPALHKPWQIAAVCVLLAVVTVVAYRGVRNNDFLTLDDYSYVLENRDIQHGVNLQSIAWALTTFHEGNWHPLAWISHMIDWDLYGKNPAGHHITNLCLHAASAVLLFLLLLYMTGFLGRSAMVAFLFALHPVHVESVAWVAERKDVLCGFFWIATLLAYAWYIRKPSWKRFVCVVIGFALSLMSKPMAVTLPFTLLLLDIWPLRRITFSPDARDRWFSSFWKLCIEKWLLFLMAAISSALTFTAQRGGGSVAELHALYLWDRIGNAAISYSRYARIMFWPHPLSPYYYYDQKNILLSAMLSAIVLVAVTAVCWHYRKEKPYCLVGWLWFLGTLTPVIGIVQVGDQAMAERYTYVPLIGLFLALIWLAGDAVQKYPRSKLAAQLLAVAIIAACAVKTDAQVKLWKDTITLFRHAVEIDSRGALPNSTLAGAYARQVRCVEAQPYFDRALEYVPPWPETLSNSAFCLMRISMDTHDRSQLPLAGQRVEQALRIAPDNVDFLNTMTLWTFLMNKPKDEEMYCRKALALRPDSVTAHIFLADALLAQGRLDEAARENRQVLALEPQNYHAHDNLAAVYSAQGLKQDAVKEYRLSLAIKPDQAMTHYNIARIFMQSHQLPEAKEELTQSLRYDPNYADAHNDLGAVLIQLGDFDHAIEQFSDAARINPSYAGARQNLTLAQAHVKAKMGKQTGK
jgi:tetratricopeptide (TPR) repeat protein